MRPQALEIQLRCHAGDGKREAEGGGCMTIRVEWSATEMRATNGVLHSPSSAPQMSGENRTISSQPWPRLECGLRTPSLGA